MANILIINSLRPVVVDDHIVPMLPRTIWACTSRGRTYPACRHNGLTMTLIRAVGLLDGKDEDLYVVPHNGDHFDCRIENVNSCGAVPKDYRTVRAAMLKPIPGIVVKAGMFQVIIEVNGKDQWFGTAADLKTAKKQLRAAKLKIKGQQA